MTASARRRKFWGWGLEGEGLSESEMKRLGETFGERFGIGQVRLQEPPRVEELDLRAPRLAPPASLEAAFSAEPYERAAHTYGRSFRDLVRAFRRDYAPAPDLVVVPRAEGALGSVLEWGCGVAPEVGEVYQGTVSVDLRNLRGVLEIVGTSHAARVAGGTLGPALEA